MYIFSMYMYLHQLFSNKTSKNLCETLKPYLLIIILSIVSLIITKLIEAVSLKLLVPKLLKLFDKSIVIDRNLYLSMLLLAAFLRSIFGFCTKFLIGYLTKSFSKDLRSKILIHMLLLPIDFFKKYSIGNLISKINYDVEQITRALSDSILNLLSSIVTIIFFIGVMFSFNWQLTLLALIISPLIYWFLRKINFRIRKYSNRLQESVGNVSHLAHEVIEACQVIRIFEAIPQETQRIKQLVNYNFKQELKIVLVSVLSESIMLMTLCSMFVLLICVAISKNFAISQEDFVGLFGAMYALIRPLKLLSEINYVLARGFAAVDSIFDLLSKPIENNNIISQNNLSVETANKHSKQLINCNIQLKKVGFYYVDKKNHISHNILSDINLNFKPQQTTAIIGKSGAGKTTLIGLLPKFYPVTSGEIYLNNININEFDLHDLRSNFTMVNQRIVLLNDTVANNIAYGYMQYASREQIIHAARNANAMEFIEQLPQGLDTNIGSNGNLLSGGQRQRIAIARAILKDAPILILDEATSALDPNSEEKIQTALAKLIQNKTTIIIAHRLSTIKQADQIAIIEDGKLVALGNYQELQHDKYFQDLYKKSLEK